MELIELGANPEVINKRGRTPMHCTAEYEEEKEDAVRRGWKGRFPSMRVWLALFHASEEWCKVNGTRPHTLLKRISSQIIRKNRHWGDDFSKVKADILSKM